MAKMKTRFVCQSCGFEAPKWFGKCYGCQAYNTAVEEVIPNGIRQHSRALGAGRGPQPIKSVESGHYRRFDTGSAEFNRVLGGGLVQGSLIVISGDPGIGKTTLLSQVSAFIADHYGTTLYVSGEESPEQIKIRSERLGTLSDHLHILSETNMDLIDGYIHDMSPSFVVLDSIQTMYQPDIQSAPGSVAQVRECTMHLTRLAKTLNIPMMVVAHVTKEGTMAGPRLLDHMVDVVLYLEGEKNYGFRMLRAFKNRFGNTAELGVYEMTEKGMEEIPDPSAYLLGEQIQAESGSAIVCSVKSARPIMVELQALVVENHTGALPRRTAVGIDRDRLNLITAVLQKRCHLPIGFHDVYVSLVGGVEINETSIDLGLAAALYSSMRDIPIPPHHVILGEVDLAGRVRPVPNAEQLVKEALKLGFEQCILPAKNLQKLEYINGIRLFGVKTIDELIQWLGAGNA
jgi:DNA repair protein RadA/Sms